MPSDERVTRAFEAVASRATQFRAAIMAARSEMQEYLEEHRARGRDQATMAATALGAFASGRIDAARFGAVLTDAHVLAPESASRLAQCVTVLDELLERDTDLFVHSVGRDEALRRTVDRALAEIGRAFGAIRVFGAVKAGSYHVAKHASLLMALPFARWSRRERELAPPLVIEVDGADLRAEHLAEYLDGDACIVLVVGGEVSPAPLVRLIAPSTLVVQTDDIAVLARHGDFTGPAVAAVVPASCASFAHDPRCGNRLEDRLAIVRLPSETPRRALGWRSAHQQAEELAQLAALAEVTAAARDVAVVVVPAAVGSGANGQGDVDAVAAWLLTQAGFDGGAG